MEPNPYLPPVTSPSDIVQPLPPDAESIRREHLNHENSIKMVGGLWILGGVLGFLGAVSVGMAELTSGKAGLSSIAIPVVILLFAAAGVFLGVALRKLKPWSRIPASILAGSGLLGFPVGTLINALILSYLLSKKGGVVFSPAYQEIIALTPHVKARTSWVVWLLLGICVVFLGILVITLFAR